MQKSTSSAGSNNRQTRRALGRRMMYAASLAATLGALTACPGEAGVVEAETQRLLILASPSEQRVAQGAVTLFTVVAERTSFTGNVTLSVDPSTVPTGVTVEFDPAVLPAGTSQSVARVSVSASAPVAYVAEPPLSNILVRAAGPGTLRDSTMLKVRLVPSALAGVTMNVTPGDVTMLVGETGEALVTIARQGNYAGPVTMEIIPTVIAGLAPAAILAPTITAVAGAPDTWRVRLFANDANKALEYARVAALTPTLSLTLRATPLGLAPVSTTMRAFLTVNRFNPQTTASTRIVAGTEATSPVQIGLNRSARFTAPITMSIDSGPAGITGTFSPNPAIDDVARLTLRVAADVAPGRYFVRVLGVPAAEAFASEQRTRVEVEVTPFVPYRFTLPTLRVVAGGDTIAPFSLTRQNGFAGRVRVDLRPLNGLPTGMTLTLAQNPIEQSATTLRVTTTSATPPGIYNVLTVGSTAGFEDVESSFNVTVEAPPITSAVARIEIEPRNAEITAPARQQYSVALFNAAGARIVAENGGTIEYSSSQPAVARISADTGVATGVAPGITSITARYLRNGALIRQDATTLTVYAAGTAGHYGSATISTNNNNTRTLRAGESLVFQVIVRNAAGIKDSTGVTPAPTVTSSSGTVSIARCTPGVLGCPFAIGYFYTMTAAPTAAVGSQVRIRYDVMGAGGEITMVIVP